MGGDPKYCKVTVRRASRPPARPRRQTVGSENYAAMRQHRRMLPPLPPYDFNAKDAVDAFTAASKEDDTDDIAVLSEDEPLAASYSRRRAHTSVTGRLSSSVLNPLSRLTQRWTEHDAEKKAPELDSHAAASSTASASSTPELLDTPPPMIDLANSFLDVDTDDIDDVERPTMDESTKLLLAGTPPIPAGLTLDMLPTELETPPIPSHLREALQFNKRQQGATATHVPSDYEDETESEYDDDDASSAAASEDYVEETKHSVDIDSIIQTREQAVANFEASLHASNRAVPRFRTTEVPTRIGGSSRNRRGLSSPQRMHSQVIRQRKATLPHADGSGAIAGYGARAHSEESNEPTAEPMYHGQELHLAFRTTLGQLTQVAGHPRRRGSVASGRNPFSRRIRCHPIDELEPLEDGDTLRIIGHTTDGLLRGGDCVSFARTDGTVLRMQKISKKLTFSNKIDVRAKFLVAGVPDRTLVTSTSKFYLQSLYDRKKTVGFLPSRRVGHPGCLAMYVYRNDDDKAEPIQFFKRQAPRGAVGLMQAPARQWM